MTVSIEISLEEAETQARLQALIERMDNRQPFFSAVGQLLEDAARRRIIETKQGPDGRAWTPLRPRTIKAREKRGQTPIEILRSNSKRKSGSPLVGSIGFDATAEEVRVGATPDYAAIHQLGGTINKAAGTRWMAGRRFARRADAPDGRDVAMKAHTITIPARPYLGVSKEDEEDIFDATERWLMP